MEQIAFIFGSRILYRSAMIVTLASLGAVCGFLGLYLRKSENGAAAFTVVPMAAILSLLLARLLDWYCYGENYPNLLAALTDYSTGGFALLGAFGGCLTAAVIVRGLKLCRDLPQMLDCMALAGGAAIAVGRLGSFFNASDRGQIVTTVRSLPWVCPLVNSVSGETEYRLATFLLQSMVTAAIVIVLLALFLTAAKKWRSGDIALLFLLCYGAAQVVLDSTRYDSIYFHSNGFISIVQVMSALAVGFVIAVFSVRLIKNGGFQKRYMPLWLVIAAALGTAGYMEYHVQRHGNEALFAYTVMTVSLLVVVALTIYIRHLAQRNSQ